MTVIDDRPVVRMGWANKYRAFWQSAPCPSWCRNDHEDRDIPEYRVCESLFTGTMIPMFLLRGWRDTETTIVIGVEVDGDDPYRITLDEAEELRDKLNALIKLGRESDR